MYVRSQSTPRFLVSSRIAFAPAYRTLWIVSLKNWRMYLVRLLLKKTIPSASDIMGNLDTRSTRTRHLSFVNKLCTAGTRAKAIAVSPKTREASATLSSMANFTAGVLSVRKFENRVCAVSCADSYNRNRLFICGASAIFTSSLSDENCWSSGNTWHSN